MATNGEQEQALREVVQEALGRGCTTLSWAWCDDHDTLCVYPVRPAAVSHNYLRVVFTGPAYEVRRSGYTVAVGLTAEQAGAVLAREYPASEWRRLKAR